MAQGMPTIFLILKRRREMSKSKRDDLSVEALGSLSYEDSPLAQRSDSFNE